MTAKLLSRQTVQVYLGLTEKQIAEASKVRPFPEPRDIGGVPFWTRKEIYDWALSLPRHGGQAQARNTTEG